MKKTLLLLFAGVMLFACNTSSNKSEEHAEQAEHANTEATELTLNNGQKWKADSVTNHNLVDLKTIADNFRIKPFPSVNDYQLLSSDLKNGLDKMIKECKMTGPDHDALHQWLNPILKNTNELKSVSDTTTGSTLFKSIDQRIDEYHNYFE